MPTYPVTINGKTTDVEADSPEGAARKAYAATKAKAPASVEAPNLWGAATSGLIPDAETARKYAAFGLRVAPGLIPNPLIAGAASAAGEAGAQMVEGKSPSEIDLTQVGLAAAMPSAAAIAARGARALGRTAVRNIPPLFAAKQQAAQEALGTTMEGLKGAVNPSPMFQVAEHLGNEAVPAAESAKVLQSLGRSIPATPASPSLKMVQEHAANVAQAIKNGSMSLEDLMKIRTDLSQSLGKAPQVKALYGGIIRDLEAAAEQGGAGAGALSTALTAFKRDLGVSKLGELVEQATKVKAVGEGAQMNVPKLTELVTKNGKELTSLLGADGMQMVSGFLRKYRTLPPEHAGTFASLFLGALSGGALGGVVPGGAATVAAVAAPEIIRNFWAVGRNPQGLNQALTTLVQAARASMSAAPSEE